MGRVKNTYHWPGEGDVLEAMAFAQKAYKIDTERGDSTRFFDGRRRRVAHVSALPESLDRS